MKIKLLLVFSISWTLTFAQQGSPLPAGARGASMGQTGVTFRDIHSIYANQAGLAYLDGFSFSAAGHQPFLLNDINQFTAAAAFPTGSGTFGLAVHTFGFDAFNEQKVGLAYARKLMDRLSIGAQIDFLNTKIREYGSKGLFTFEIGVQGEIIPELLIGAHIYSPIRPEMSNGESIPTVFKFGFAYLPNAKARVLLEVEKHIDFKVALRGGIEYYIVDALALRAGATTQPATATFGMGFLLKNGLSLDAGAAYHEVLGITPSAGLSIQIKK